MRRVSDWGARGVTQGRGRKEEREESEKRVNVWCGGVIEEQG